MGEAVRSAECRHCGAMIVWCKNENGKWIPVNRSKDHGSVVIADPGSRVPVARRLKKGEPYPGEHHLIHFVTCQGPEPVQTTVTCDICGEPSKHDVSSVFFILDERSGELRDTIGFCDIHAVSFRDAIKKWLAANLPDESRVVSVPEQIAKFEDLKRDLLVQDDPVAGDHES